MGSRLLSWACALVACSPPETTLRGHSVELVAEPEQLDRLCDGSFPFLDDVSGLIAARLRRHDPPRIRYHWQSRGVAGTCSYELAGGCSIDGEVFASGPFIVHELVHAHAAAFNRADPFLEEGLAEYLGGDRHTPARGDPREYYGQQRHLADPSFYPLAGRFVGELVALAGIERVVELYKASNYDDSAEVFETKLKDHLGVEVDDVVAGIRSAHACGSLAYREKPIVCGRVPEEISVDPDAPAVLSHDFDCGLPGTLGTVDSMHAYRTLSVTTPGLFRITTDEDTSVMLIPCAPLCEHGDVLDSEALEELVELRVGTYAARLARSDPGTSEVTFARE